MKMTFGIRISDEAEKLGTNKAEVGVLAMQFVTDFNYELYVIKI